MSIVDLAIFRIRNLELGYSTLYHRRFQFSSESDSYSLYSSQAEVLLDLLLELIELLVLTHGLVRGNQLVASAFELFHDILLARNHAEMLGCWTIACAILLRQFGVNQVELVDEVIVGYPAVL